MITYRGSTSTLTEFFPADYDAVHNDWICQGSGRPDFKTLPPPRPTLHPCCKVTRTSPQPPTIRLSRSESLGDCPTGATARSTTPDRGSTTCCSTTRTETTTCSTTLLTTCKEQGENIPGALIISFLFLPRTLWKRGCYNWTPAQWIWSYVVCLGTKINEKGKPCFSLIW